MKKYLIIAFFLVLVDQLTKMFAERVLVMPVDIVSGWFQFVLRYNTGIAFSLPVPMYLVIPLTIIFITLGTILSYLYLNWENKLYSIFFCLVFSGAIGNLIDRIVIGRVIDFIKIWLWPVFNLADIYITIAALILIYDTISNRPTQTIDDSIPS